MVVNTRSAVLRLAEDMKVREENRMAAKKKAKKKR